MRGLIIGLIVSLAVLLSGIFLMITNTPTIYAYTGRFAFQTEQEYSQFKEFLVAHPDIDIKEKITVLSSAPPILVDYRYLIIPIGEQFNYEYTEKSVYEGNHTNVMVPLILFGGIATLTFMILICNQTEEGEN